MNAYSIRTLAAFLIMAAGVFSVYGQQPAKTAAPMSETERFIRAFYDAYAEAFQICEYGRIPSADELRELFPL